MRCCSPLLTGGSAVPALTLLFFSLLKCSCAIPRRGIEPWSIILCKFKDLAHYEPKTREWFQAWLNGPGEQDSIEQFFWQLSNGVYSISGSEVHGCFRFTLDHTRQEVLQLAKGGTATPAAAAPPTPTTTTTDGPEMPPLGSELSFDYFDKIKDLCVQKAMRNATLHRQKITVVNAGTAAVYGKRNGVLLTPQLVFSSVLTHEMVHSFFIGHSYSDKKIKVFPYASDGEYDDRYDLMSTANAYMHRSNFGMNGPGLNGAHLDYLGWLPMDRVLYFGRDGRQNYTLRLSSLSIPHNKTIGWLLVQIPYDRDDPGNYFTVELRTPHQFDRGISQPSILIHRVHRKGDSYYSQLISQSEMYELTDENTEWVNFLEPLASAAGESAGQMRSYQLIRVTLRRIYPTDADVLISSTFNPSGCHMGERVLRPARWSQPYIIGLRHVCFAPDAHMERAKKSNLKRSVANSSSTQKRVGRILDEAELRKQFARKNFFEMRTTFGANSCRQGLVWRSLDAYDYVCVTEKRRDSAQREDAAQQEERMFSSNFLRQHDSIMAPCIEPFMPRRAFPGDNICVSAAEKFRIFRENLQAYSTLQHVAFFNGLDTVGP